MQLALRLAALRPALRPRALGPSYRCMEGSLRRISAWSPHTPRALPPPLLHTLEISRATYCSSSASASASASASPEDGEIEVSPTVASTPPARELAGASRFAVLELAGIQYKVAKDDIIACEKLPVEVGQKIRTHRILLVGERDGTILGSPLIAGASVDLTVEEQAVAEKEIVFKKKRRKGYRRWKGYRQRLTLLRIGSIELPPLLDAQLQQAAAKAES